MKITDILFGIVLRIGIHPGQHGADGSVDQTVYLYAVHVEHIQFPDHGVENIDAFVDIEIPLIFIGLRGLGFNGCCD
ncbi:hypothetical protein SDC9_95146 [bioreactor metagenome]|uniref:Uncharacterized protein n=1 Tax=bioreactor metagenome TaxID=1076179 RepID=A0A645A809_9ZZZZ